MIIGEYGVDLSMFADEGAFLAHAGLTPRTPITGGKPIKGRRGKTKSTRTAEALKSAAVALAHSRTATGAYYRSVARNTSSGGKAVFATARKLGSYVFRMLRYGQDYVDIGEQKFNERLEKLRLRNLFTRADQMGYQPKSGSWGGGLGMK